MARKDHGRICIAFVFAYVVGKNPKTPNLSPMTNNNITRGGIGGLGSPVYIYGLYPRIIVSMSHEKYINVCGYSDQVCKIPHTTYIHTHIHTYIHNTYRMSDHIVSFWTQLRWDKNVEKECRPNKKILNLGQNFQKKKKKNLISE